MFASMMCFLVSIMLMKFPLSLPSNNQKEEEPNMEVTNSQQDKKRKQLYICNRETKSSYRKINSVYRLLVDENNNIYYTLQFTQYIYENMSNRYEDKSNYYYHLYLLKNSDTDSSKVRKDNSHLTVTVIIQDGPLKDDVGKKVTISQKVYLNDLLNNGYVCDTHYEY